MIPLLITIKNYLISNDEVVEHSDAVVMMKVVEHSDAGCNDEKST